MNQDPSIFLGKANILVVDDTPANITLLTQILSNQGYKVRVAPSGKLALKSVQFMVPDLILLDVKMPDLNGYQVCRQLKAQPSTRDIPVIFMSALDDALDKVTAFTLGGVDYITKPFESIEVIARIENQLRLREFQLQLQAQNAQLQLLLATAQAISETADAEEALLAILSTVCQTIGWDFGEAWMPNSEATHLEYCCAWRTDPPNLIEFQRQAESLRFAYAQGFPGRIWASQQIEWIADLAEQPCLMNIRSLAAEQASLKSVLGVPIVLDGQVLAVLVFFHHQELAPDERSLRLFKAIATQLGSMIQRKKAEDALRQANWELERLANLDGLTQLANRRRFDVYFRQQWQSHCCDRQPLSIILFDVDYFKPYNDFYGHQAGDECLQQLSIAARQAINQPADLVARYGGEEFVAVLPNTPVTQALEIAEQLRQAVQQLRIPHRTSQVNEFVTVSIGVASSVPLDTELPDTLIAAADRALYQAKEQGRDRLVLAPQSDRISRSPSLHSQNS
ncbi:diguanylate cyclase [Oscillatoria amoena NRMC-F 0135]|nr:diguanylate cyclase [Geitlerinema splendidum]MDL5047479.1 diguanylate cyclase [Oscillatoria amoena NRMC-F 0135]